MEQRFHHYKRNDQRATIDNPEDMSSGLSMVPRRSMKAIVMLFTNKTKTDSEEYIYPNIEKVRVTIEGVPNAVYSQGISKTRLYE